MNTASNNYKVRNCSKCQEDAEFYCKLCRCDFCLQCKERHVQDFVTIDHNVVVYRDKVKRTSEQELPISYKQGRQQHREKVCNIRSQALFYRHVLLAETKTDIEKCHIYFSRLQAEMFTKAQSFMDHTDIVLSEFDIKHRCALQGEEQNKNIVNIQSLEKNYENSTTTPVQFLVMMKKHYISQTKAPQITHHLKFGMNEWIGKKRIQDLLSGIRIKQREKRKMEKKLKLMPVPTIYQSFRANELRSCHHISCVTSDRIWVNDGYGKSILINTAGNIIHSTEDLCKNTFTGLQTVNTEGELIYIDAKYNINKLSKSFCTTHSIIEKPQSEWRPHSVYSSNLNGDLLVAMIKFDSKTGFKIKRKKEAENDKNIPRDHTGQKFYSGRSGIGKVIRYNQSGQQKQTILHNSCGFYMYRNPSRITENINGDVVVSDSDWPGAVFVTDSGGKYRFTYTGHPLGPSLMPWGICTDALSHILVCDASTQSIQVIDSNGQYQKHLLIRPLGILSPCGLAYNFNTHCLWIGSTDMTKICVYRYITREQDSKIDQMNAVVDSQSNNIEMKTSMSPPDINQSLILSSINDCSHISCVTSDKIWISDKENNLLLTNTVGDALYYVEDFHDISYLRQGLHTVNNQGELFYVDKFNDINKLSYDMETITTFIGKTEESWSPWCMQWSPFSNDLLVVNWRLPWASKVDRYNRTGKLIHTTQFDSTGQEIYYRPIYITENSNRDIVVSDKGAVVVTSCEGKYRFSYTGHPQEKGLDPLGICTDEFSHILVCDKKTNTVQVIDKNGQFLFNLLSEQNWIKNPCCLCYDVNTHTLWVGSHENNRIYVYKYNEQDIPSANSKHFAEEGFSSFNRSPNTIRPQRAGRIGRGRGKWRKHDERKTRLHCIINANEQELERLKEFSEIISKHEDKTTEDERTHNMQNIQNTGNQKTNIAGLPRSVDQNSGRRRRSSKRDILRADNQELEEGPNFTGPPRSVDQTSVHIRRSNERDILRADNQELEEKLAEILRAIDQNNERLQQSNESPTHIQESPDAGRQELEEKLADIIRAIEQNNERLQQSNESPTYFQEITGAGGQEVEGIPSFGISRTIDRAGGRGQRSNESPLHFREIPNADNRKLEERPNFAEPPRTIDQTSGQRRRSNERDIQRVHSQALEERRNLADAFRVVDQTNRRSHRSNESVIYHRDMSNPDNKELEEIRTKQRETPPMKNNLKLMHVPVMHKSFRAKDIHSCHHISCLTSDQVWVNDGFGKSILINTAGNILHLIEDLCKNTFTGLQTLNSEGELIYIDANYNINKMSKSCCTTATIMEKPRSDWRPHSVYCSNLNGDLLVAMIKYDLKTGYEIKRNKVEENSDNVPRDHTGQQFYNSLSGIGKIIRYNPSGQQKQTILYDGSGFYMYRNPSRITENNNGDVVVSDSDWPGAIFVTDSRGNYRFTYTGHPLGPSLKPWGICTDVMSHILVCDASTHTVQIIDGNGQFKKHLLIRPLGILSPCGLAYDVNTHCLWIGSTDMTKICVYRYIASEQDSEIDQNNDLMNSQSNLTNKDTEKPMLHPDIYLSLTLTDINGSDHMSSLTSDEIWISDKDNNLLLINTAGDALHYIEDFCETSHSRRGLHAVNNHGELFYVDKFDDINKLANDMETITTFIGKTDKSWQPWCLYWSPFSGDLLVALWRLPWASKVARYNQNGRLTHTTQFDRTGQEIYFRPKYITENTNGDVVVSDLSAVVVTTYEGSYRFSYTGHPREAGIDPLGICSDELSHILVCDDRTNSVQIIDKDGQFLLNLLSKQNWIKKPCCLNYDVNTHSLWIGSHSNNRIYVYRYKEQDINSATSTSHSEHRLFGVNRGISSYTGSPRRAGTMGRCRGQRRQHDERRLRLFLIINSSEEELERLKDIGRILSEIEDKSTEQNDESDEMTWNPQNPDHRRRSNFATMNQTRGRRQQSNEIHFRNISTADTDELERNAGNSRRLHPTVGGGLRSNAMTPGTPNRELERNAGMLRRMHPTGGQGQRSNAMTSDGELEERVARLSEQECRELVIRICESNPSLVSNAMSELLPPQQEHNEPLSY